MPPGCANSSMPESHSLTGGPCLSVNQRLVVAMMNGSIATRNLADVARVGDDVFENIGGEPRRRRPVVSQVRRSRGPDALLI